VARVLSNSSDFPAPVSVSESERFFSLAAEHLTVLFQSNSDVLS